MNDYREIQEMIETERAKGAFIFMPSPILSMEDSFYKPVVETVYLREDEIYTALKKFRIHYNGLLRLSSAAAFEWSAIDTCRTDARNDRMYISFRAVGGVRKADGKVYFHKAEKDIDFEIVEMELEDQYKKTWADIGDNKNVAWKKNGHKTIDTFVPAMVRRDLIQKRKNGLTNVESGAKARVIRAVLGLQGNYSDKGALIGMPFIMVSYSPNIKHPAVNRVLTQALPESMNAIYGGAKDTGQIPYVDPDHNNPDVITVPNDDAEQKGPEQKESGFQPKKEKSAPVSNAIDFENSSIDDQVKTLKMLCDLVPGENYDEYNKGLEGGIKGTDQGWRSGFFEFLLAAKEKK